MSRRAARWIVAPPVDEGNLDRLAEELGLPRDISRLLALRGHTTADMAKVFLRPRLDQLHAALSMMGLNDAVQRLAHAIASRERVMVHGDYDVDGICSTTLLTRTLLGLGGDAFPFIPHRLTDGYDLGPAGVQAAIDAGAKIVVTCDCGTSAVEPIARLNAAGIDVIVSDHHLPGGQLPESLAVLNPKRPGCEYPDKDLAAVGVAFKLALELARTLGKNDAFIWRMLDLVALATVADIAPLRGENRVFVRYGLKMMAETENTGLRALIRVAGLEGKPITAGRVGYILAPRLNAVGRLGSAMRGVQLLMSDSAIEAETIAHELEELNRQRQQLDRATLDQARDMVVALPLQETYGIVLAHAGWHPGVIGIVASRIVEEFGRPTLLIALEDGSGKGSGRSISAFDLHAALHECSDLLLRYGGHRAAAGITIAEAQVVPFAERFNDIAKRSLTSDDLVSEVRVDIELDLQHANEELENVLRHFEPFGVGNPSPVFAARNVTLAGPPRLVGRDGLKLRLLTPAGELDAIGWGMGELATVLNVGTPVDIAFRLERDEYQGQSRLQAKIADIVPSLMRIVAGAWRGRLISAPAGDHVRPTRDRIRQAWLNIVNLDLPGAHIVDLCAGSGALGLEALSRGASVADFVDNDTGSLLVLRANIAALGASTRAKVHKRDALQFAHTLEEHAFDVAFADPPYASDAAKRLAERWLEVPYATLLGIEHASTVLLPPGGEIRRYGTSSITFYRAK